MLNAIMQSVVAPTVVAPSSQHEKQNQLFQLARYKNPRRLAIFLFLSRFFPVY
jgi:hypothetical protein